VPARVLVPLLLPLAREGLVAHGVGAGEVDRLLDIVAARVAAGQTGAAWQRRVLARLEARQGRTRALAGMLQRYLSLADSDAPVHTWPVSD
jgi:hypothetical protein